MKTENGFTLIELLVTVAVVSILLAVGVPEFKRMTENNRQVALINHLAASLNLARSEAIKQAQTVTVCASSNGTTCAGSADWTTGWIVFRDPDRDGILAATGDLLNRQGTLPAGIALKATQFDDNTQLRYLPNGRLEQLAGGTDPDGTFVLCDTRTNDATLARALNVNALGRVSLAQDPDSNGIRNDVENSDVTCP